MERILKIWFDGEWLYGHGDDDKIYRQSLLWYKPLMAASQEQRQRCVFSGEGIHWRELDTDVSFESFLYPEAEPSDFASPLAFLEDLAGVSVAAASVTLA